MWLMSDVPSFQWTFTVDQPSILRAYGHIDVAHRGLYGTKNRPLMVALRITLNRSLIPGSVTGTNIVGVEQHYAIIPVHAYKELPIGTHTVRLQARSASSYAHGMDGLAEIKGGYSEVVYEVRPK
jgi:hypothetical protein